MGWIEALRQEDHSRSRRRASIADVATVDMGPSLASLVPFGGPGSFDLALHGRTSLPELCARWVGVSALSRFA
jgi:hypothetical protein